jgi:glycerophosphoryl diester phosphodiesterase
MSRDGSLVLFHDAVLTKVGGGPRSVAEVTLSELSALDWGKWYHPEFTGEPLTTFESALGLLGQCPRLLVEIKSHHSEQKSGHAYRLTQQLIATLGRSEWRPFHQKIYVLSFDPKVLTTAHGLAPHLRYVLNLGMVPSDLFEQQNEHLWGIDVQIGKLDATIVKTARQRNLRVLTYTCNQPDQVAKALSLGVDGIISDRPSWLIKLVHSKAPKS